MKSPAQKGRAVSMRSTGQRARDAGEMGGLNYLVDPRPVGDLVANRPDMRAALQALPRPVTGHRRALRYRAAHFGAT